MKSSRREFVATGLAGMAALYSHPARSEEQTPRPANEDGYRLWLRYAPPGDAAPRYRSLLRSIVVEGSSPTLDIIRSEVRQALDSMFGAAPTATALQANALVIGTPATSPAIRKLGWDKEL
jgi:alpha-glucuronidase